CRMQPARPELWLELARMLHAQARDAEIAPMLEAAVACNPGNEALVRAQGEVLLKLKRYGPALEAYRQLGELEASPTRATLLHTGFCLEQLGHVVEAAQWYRKAIALDANFMEAHVDLAGLLWRLEDFDGALAHARRAMEIA